MRSGRRRKRAVAQVVDNEVRNEGREQESIGYRMTGREITSSAPLEEKRPLLFWSDVAQFGSERQRRLPTAIIAVPVKMTPAANKPPGMRGTAATMMSRFLARFMSAIVRRASTTIKPARAGRQMQYVTHPFGTTRRGRQKQP